MGIYGTATENRDTSLFQALLGYLNLIINNTGSTRLEVPVRQISTITEVRDVIITRNDKPLVGVRITVTPSFINKESIEVPLSEEEIKLGTQPESSDDAAIRLRKATLPKTKFVEKRSYGESVWSIALRTKDKDTGFTYCEFSGTPFDTDEIEKAFMSIIEIVKPTN